MSDTIRVLHIVTYMGRGGLETMLMNYYRNIDRTRVQFDFLVHRKFEADYDAEINALGGRIFRLPALNPFDPKYRQALDHFFREHKEYKIVHCHLDCMAGLPLKYAKKNGVPVRIAHAHNSNQNKDKKYLLKLLYKKLIPNYANLLFACGIEAGNWMFGNHKFSVLNNAIDVSAYSYDEVIRDKKRLELKLSQDALVVGHVGSFRPQKNHEFLIKIFNELSREVPNSYLLLVGDGDLMEPTKQLVKDLNLSERVIFAGSRNDVPELLQAMDVFLFPSLFEGLSLATIEVQAAGLPCVMSDNIPQECIKTDLVNQLSLTDSLGKWVNAIKAASHIKRRVTYEEIKNAGFDIVSNATKLQHYYQGLVRKNIGYKKTDDIDAVSSTVEMNQDVLLTVFTPAFNRAHTLIRTYESLKNQDCKDFIWLIIDDGSSDNTRELVERWQSEEQDFQISYIYKENGGMHTAHNIAYENIDTVLNVCIDSDDCLAPGAVRIILEKWDEIKEENYAGIIGLDADLKGGLIGKGFPIDMKETTLMGYYAQGGRGDKKLVYRTEIINQYPAYPIFDDEKYVALAYKYRLIDQDYKLAVLDEILCNVEYQADGSSGTMWKQYLKYPKGFAFWRKICMKYPESKKRLVIDCVHYISNSLIAKDNMFIVKSPKPILTTLLLPLGFILFLVTNIKGKL